MNLDYELFRTFVPRMKVLIINTYERLGGAAVAANRLMEALINNGVKAKMLVRDKQSDQLTVVSLPHPLRLRWNFLWERLVIFIYSHFSKKHLFEIDLANAGTDITRLPEFQEADVIHLHWINQGMLSLKNIQKILQSGKPVVWTMHDLWPATAICHYARGCKQFKTQCESCQLLPKFSPLGNLTASIWKKKQRTLQAGNIYFSACSRWLEGEARKSALLKEQLVTNIPNPIDTHVFHPASSKAKARKVLGLTEKGNVLLFVSQKITDERKGIRYFVDAIQQLSESHPELKESTTIALLGGHSDEIAQQLSFPVKSLGFISDEKTIVSVYQAANVFVTPSLEDNLPNTIMESMACGTPCVGFRVGGIPEMIDHQKNGYVAEFRSAEDLANGIGWVLSNADYDALCQHAVRKVAQNYSQSSVAVRYIELYQHAIAQKQFKL